jgi:hypothetical protein
MSISLAHCITQKNHFFTSAWPLGSRSLVLVHRHVHSTDLLSHCITQESHLEFLINSSTQRRLIHHLHFCSHDNAPSRTPCPRVLPPIHLILTTWPREGLLGKHSLTWGLTYPIGHHDTPPIPKFGKFYKVFEHLFSLKRGT